MLRPYRLVHRLIRVARVIRRRVGARTAPPVRAMCSDLAECAIGSAPAERSEVC